MPSTQKSTEIRKYSDFDLSFRPHPVSGDLVKVTGTNSVVQALKNLIQLNYYDVPFHPEIGGNVRSLLFEMVDGVTANLLADEIKNIVKNFEPRVDLHNVWVDADTDHNGFNVTLVFSILNSTQTYTVDMFLQRVR